MTIRDIDGISVGDRRWTKGVRITPVQLAVIIYFTQSDTPVEDSNKDDHQQCLSIKVCYTLTVIDYA